MWNNSYRTPTERWQKTSDLPKGKKLPMYLGVGQKKKEKRQTKESGRDLHLWEGPVQEEKFPHTRKPLHWWKARLIQPRLLYPERISFRFNGEIKTFTDKQKLREFSTTKRALQQMLKELL